MTKGTSTRRSFLKGAAGAAVILCGTAARGAATRPNIVLIMSDDMGFSDIGCFGGEIATPNLDGLAADGLRFTRFHGCNMCVPSRATLMTGSYARSSLRNSHISGHYATLPELLRDAGYATAMTGKWHLAKEGDLAQYPCQRGYDRFYGTIYGANSFFQPFSLHRDNENAEADFQAPDFYYTDAISDNAARYIHETPEDKPLFLSVAYTAAHWPLHALPEDIEKYRGKYAMGWDKLRETRYARMKKLGVIPKNAPLSERNPEVPAWEDVEDKDWQERRMEVYAAQIDRMDQGIGKILSALRESGRFDNTLVVYMIDNGACHVEYGPERKGDFLPEKTRGGRPMRPGNVSGLMPGGEDTFASYGYGWANASNTPYRHYKKYANWGGVRTQMIAHWPNTVRKPGTIVEDIVHLIDILPTCMDIAGAKLPADKRAIDGASLLPLLEGGTRDPHERLFWEWAVGAAILEGGWKLVRIKRQDWELYNIAEDPVEVRNLAARHPERVKALEATWTTWSETRAAMD